MPEVNIPNVGVVQFPDTLSLDDVNKQAARIYNESGKTAAARLNANIPSTELRTPPTIGDYALAGLRSALTEVAPMAGLMIGGSLGAASGGLVGGVRGGALGYTGGRQLNRVLGTLFTPQTNVGAEMLGVRRGETSAPTALQTAQDVGEDYLTGLMIEMTSPMGVLLARRGISLGKDVLGIGSVTPEDLAVRFAAERQGIPITAAIASGSVPVATIESIPGRFPIGQQTTIGPFKRLQKGFQGATERLLEQFGPTRTLEQAGQSIQADISAVVRARSEGPSTLLESFIDSINPIKLGKRVLGASAKEAAHVVELSRRAEAHNVYETAIAGRGMTDTLLTNLQRVSGNIAQFEARLAGLGTRAGRAAAGINAEITPEMNLSDEAVTELLRTASKGIRDAILNGTFSPKNLPFEFILRYGLNTTGTRTLEEALGIQQRLAAATRNATDDVVKRQFRQLHDAVADDIIVHGAGTALADAAKFYKETVAQYFGEKTPLRRLFGKSPGRVGAILLNTTDPDILQGIMDVLPEKPKSQVQRAVLDKIKQDSIDIATGEVSPIKLENQLTKYGDENLDILLGTKNTELTNLRKTIQTNFGRDTSNEALVKLLTAEPKGIVNALARGKIKSTDDFDAIWSNLGTVTKQEMRSALYNEVLTNSFDPTTNIFSSKRYMAQVRQIPQAIWDRMLTGNPAAALNDLSLVSRRINHFSSVAANPSGTAQGIFGPGQVLKGMNLALTAGQAGAAALVGGQIAQGDIPDSKELFALLSPLALGLLVFSKGGQKALTSSVPPPFNPRGLGSNLLRGFGSAGQEILNPSLRDFP